MTKRLSDQNIHNIDHILSTGFGCLGGSLKFIFWAVIFLLVVSLFI